MTTPPLAGTIAFLRTVDLFREFGLKELVAVAAHLGETRLERGEVLFKEGDVGTAMYFVCAGTVVISKAVTKDIDHVLVRLGPGGFFGEMSLFDKLPRSATVQAASDVALLTLDRAGMERVLAENPKIAPAFFRSLFEAFVGHLRATDTLVENIAQFSLQLAGVGEESP